MTIALVFWMLVVAFSDGGEYTYQFPDQARCEQSRQALAAYPGSTHLTRCHPVEVEVSAKFRP